MYGWCFDIKNLLPLCILSIKIHRMPVDPCLKYTLSYNLLLLPKQTMLPNPFSQDLTIASASAAFMQVTTWYGQNCHGSSEVVCKSKTTRHNVSVKRSSSSSQHTPQDIDHKTSHCFPIPSGSFNGLHWDFINHGGMHCKMTTW